MLHISQEISPHLACALVATSSLVSRSASARRDPQQAAVMGESEYSFSLTTFSPSGKLVQIEYALQAVSGGATSLGIKAKNGIVLATEKKPPALMDESTFQKITLLTEHIGMVYSGIAPDFRVLVRKGRKAAAKYYQQYHEPIPVSQLVRELASVMQEYTQSGCASSVP